MFELFAIFRNRLEFFFKEYDIFNYVHQQIQGMSMDNLVIDVKAFISSIF